MKVNTRLRVLRAERGLSQLETATLSGISMNRYWRIENGYAQATTDEQDALAKVFAVEREHAFPAAVAS